MPIKRSKRQEESNLNSKKLYSIKKFPIFPGIKDILIKVSQLTRNLEIYKRHKLRILPKYLITNL